MSNETAEITETPAPAEQPATDAGERPTVDAIVAAARDYVAAKGQGKGMHARAMMVCAALVDSADGTEPAPTAPPGDEQRPGAALPDEPEGDFGYLLGALSPSEDGRAVHLGQRLNHTLTRREAIAVALGVLRAVRAIP